MTGSGDQYQAIGVVGSTAGGGERQVEADDLFARHYLEIREQAAAYCAPRLFSGPSACRAFARHADCEPAELADAVDLVLDAVERKLRAHLGQLREQAKFAPWLYQVTLNACRDELRALRRNPWTRTPLEAAARVTGGELDPLARALACRAEESQRQSPGGATAPERLDVATRATGKLAYLPPHDLELEPDELRYLAAERGEPVDVMLDALGEQLAPLHEAAIDARADHAQRSEDRLGRVYEGLLRLQQQMRAQRQHHDPARPQQALQEFELRFEKLCRQRDRLLEEKRKSRPRLWRVPSEQLARFLRPAYDTLEPAGRKRVLDAINQRLTRFRAAFRADCCLEASSGHDAGDVHHA